MRQLREFAQHADEFDHLKARLVAVSVDDQEHAHLVWDKMAGRKFIILSDPGANVIRQYGLLHAQGRGDTDIAIRTTFVIDENGRERWRRVSTTIPDIPKAEEVLRRLREMR
ncbi:MAG: redoxin domain-containing protein [Candidatus Koribacter versatilis]|nr:redoxin domain-containing protein [Candidatus Koribacter versatilis]